MLPRRVTIPLAVLVGILLWRRATRRPERVDGVEAEDLLEDVRELLAILA